MIVYTAERNPPLKPIEFRIFNSDIGLGIVGCVNCHMGRGLTMARIQGEVSDYFDIPAYEMKSNRRSRSVARPRQIAMFLAKELTPKSLPEIGRRFGDRDHTTVIHAIRKVKELMESDPKISADVEILRERLAA